MNAAQGYEFRETATSSGRRETGTRTLMKSLLAQTRLRELDRMEAAVLRLKELRAVGEGRSTEWYRLQHDVQRSRLAYDSAAEMTRDLQARGY